MQLKEIRDLFVLFLKQLNKEDVNLFLNYLPIFLEDIQRDPLLLDKISLPAENLLNFNLLLANKLNNLVPTPIVNPIVNPITNPPVIVAPILANSEASTSDDEIKNENESTSGTDEKNEITNINQTQNENEDEANSTDNILSYESYNEDEDEENNYEPNVVNSQLCDITQLVRSRLPANIVEYLTKMYNVNKYPNSDEIYQMSLETKLTTKRIKNWFDSTRFKLKHSKKSNFTPKIVDQLMDAFTRNPTPTRKEILKMVSETKLTEAQVANWFKQKRISSTS